MGFIKGYTDNDNARVHHRCHIYLRHCDKIRAIASAAHIQLRYFHNHSCGISDIIGYGGLFWLGESASLMDSMPFRDSDARRLRLTASLPPQCSLGNGIHGAPDDAICRQSGKISTESDDTP